MNIVENESEVKNFKEQKHFKNVTKFNIKTIIDNLVKYKKDKIFILGEKIDSS